MKDLRIKFTGNKEEIHKQLKAWCALAEQTMNKTVIEAIDLYLKQNKNKN